MQGLSLRTLRNGFSYSGDFLDWCRGRGAVRVSVVLVAAAVLGAGVATAGAILAVHVYRWMEWLIIQTLG